MALKGLVRRKTVAEILKERKLLDEKILEAAAEKAKKEDKPIQQVIVEDKLMKKPKLLKVLSEEWQVKAVDLSQMEPDEEIVQIIPEAVARRHQAIPFAKEESILFVGCGKDADALNTGIERFHKASLRARKMRMMGSAALGLAYVATGRLDAYIEFRISLWDIAAGQLLVESAGGKVTLTQKPGKADSWAIVATNGKIPIEEIL